jgi:hypothetical protein
LSLGAAVVVAIIPRRLLPAAAIDHHRDLLRAEPSLALRTMGSGISARSIRGVASG